MVTPDRGHKVSLALALLVSLLVVCLAIPRFMASILKGPAFPVVLATNQGMVVEKSQLESAIKYMDFASKWERSGRADADIGFLFLVMSAQTTEDNSDKIKFARRAAEKFREALLQAPAQPRVWVRLAYAEMMVGGPSTEMFLALQQSYSVGRFVGSLTTPRLELLFRNWDGAPRDLQSLAQEQIRMAWLVDKASLVRILKKAQLTTEGFELINAIDKSIRSIPGAYEEFNGRLIEPGR